MRVGDALLQEGGGVGELGLRFALERAVAEGARLAEPGEFTLRAYLNGRIDGPMFITATGRRWSEPS